MSNLTVIWTIKIRNDVSVAIQNYDKRHPRETASVLVNLDRIMDILKQGKRIGGFQFGFFRSEGGSLYRIGQTGVKAAKETRLYVYPDEVSHTMHVIGIGDKDNQTRDIRNAKTRMAEIRALSSALKTSSKTKKRKG